MRTLLIIALIFSCSVSFSQDRETEKTQIVSDKKANNLVYEGNTLIEEDKFIAAEKKYRKAISKKPTSIAGSYNLGNTYFNRGYYDAALYRQQQAAKNATDKTEKHKAFHNIGNILMKNKKCKEAVEAYKNALRNDPTDDETRYNLALAKECAEQQKNDQPDENQGKDKQNKEDKKDQNKDQNDKNQDKKDQQDQDNKDKKDDQKDQDKKDGEDEKEKDQPKDDKGDQDQNQQQQPQPGKLSPQQIKNLLEAMSNHEQKVQEKINAEKQKGVKVKTDKDW